MKFLFMYLTLMISLCSFGVECSAYATLTNKLSQIIVEDSWSYETNNSVCIKTRLLPIKVDERFSDEIIASFKEVCPGEWKDAVSSSGNVHNPKMLPLRRHFEDVVLRTPSIQKFLAVVKKEIGNEAVLRIHHEKLEYTVESLNETSRKRTIRCFLWVEVRFPMSSKCKND